MSETALLAATIGPLAVAVLLIAAGALWAVWPGLSAAWTRAGLPSVRLVWPEPEEEEEEAAPTLALPIVWPVPLERVEATPDHDHLKEAA